MLESFGETSRFFRELIRPQHHQQRQHQPQPSKRGQWGMIVMTTRCKATRYPKQQQWPTTDKLMQLLVAGLAYMPPHGPRIWQF
jgi:hypothetical protein